MNHNKISVITNHFRINHSFHEPYEVLLDGNFIKLIVEKGQPFFRKLEELLNGKVFWKVTECIIRQLQLLGQRFKFVLEEAKKQQFVKCRHMIGTTPKMCIQQLIGETNPKKYMVCTQDIELRRNIRQLPNVPIFYFGPDQRITMQDIPREHKQLVMLQAKQRMAPAAHELKPIDEYREKKKEEEQEKQKKQQLKLLSQMGLKAKKVTRGPNPLAVKKKKKVRPQQPSSNDAVIRPKRIRKRKRKQETQPS